VLGLCNGHALLFDPESADRIHGKGLGREVAVAMSRTRYFCIRMTDFRVLTCRKDYGKMTCGAIDREVGDRALCRATKEEGA
jgi:hypothetical protein